MENPNTPTIPTPAGPPVTPGIEAGPAAIPGQVPVTPVAEPVIAERGGFLRDITLMDVGMIALVTLALVTSIYVNRQHLLLLRGKQKTEGSEIDELKANLQTVMGSNYKSF